MGIGYNDQVPYPEFINFVLEKSTQEIVDEICEYLKTQHMAAHENAQQKILDFAETENMAKRYAFFLAGNQGVDDGEYNSSGVITTDQIGADAITAAKVADAVIAAEHIATGAIEEAKIAADAVTATKIAVAGLDGTSGNVAANHIVANMLQTNCVTSIKIQADAVTATKINVVGLNGATGRIVVTDATDANVVTAGINTHAVTLINAGKILISGATALSDWSSGVDATYIDGGKIYANTITASQINAGTITADEIHAGTITADNLVAGLQVKWTSSPSDNTRNSNDTEKTHTGSSYTKIKETKLNEDTGELRIYFELKSNGGAAVRAHIYKNGVALGTIRVTSETSYQPFTEDLGVFVTNDLIQIYAYSIADTAYVCNFRLQYDRAVSIIAGETLTTPLTTVDQTVFSVTNQDP